MEYLQNLDGSQIAGLILFIIGFKMLVISSYSIANSFMAREWTMTKGRIIHSDVYTSESAGEASSYRPNIVFEYSVFGEKFICDRLFYGVDIMSSLNLGNSKKLIKKYPVNKEVTVYYNPDKPKQSVVEPGLHFGLCILFFVAVCMVIIGGIYLAQY